MALYGSRAVIPRNRLDDVVPRCDDGLDVEARMSLQRIGGRRVVGVGHRHDEAPARARDRHDRVPLAELPSYEGNVLGVDLVPVERHRRDDERIQLALVRIPLSRHANSLPRKHERGLYQDSLARLLRSSRCARARQDRLRRRGFAAVAPRCSRCSSFASLVGWAGAFPPRPPTDPDVPNSGIRLFVVRVRYAYLCLMVGRGSG
jgi:hypothetical protein